VKLLKDILFKARIQQVHGSTNVAVEHITMDSRQVKPLSLFVAVEGVTVDGHQYITRAIESGANAIVCEKLPANMQEGVTYIQVLNSQEALGYIASNYYENPSEKIQIEKNELKISNNEAANVEELTRLKKEEIRASIKAAKARYQKAISGGSKSPFPKNYVRPNIMPPRKDGSVHFSMTKPITITATGSGYTFKGKDGKTVTRKGVLDATGKGAAMEFEVTKIIRTPENKFAAIGYQTTGGLGKKGAAKQIILSNKDSNDLINKLGGMDPVNRFSNSLALMELGFPDIPNTYLNIEQDTSPNGDWADQ
jgi:hypothetical protein